jgi:hypothetical protein
MDAEAFMREHADKASSGRIPEVMGDLTPEALQQLMPLMAGGPTALTGNIVTHVSTVDGDYVFDVTYSDNDGKSVSMRETVRELEGKWRIVKLEKPS